MSNALYYTNEESRFRLITCAILFLILMILGTALIPQYIGAEKIDLAQEETNRAKKELRQAIDAYAKDHGGIFPGAHDTAGSGQPPDPGMEETIFRIQLTIATDSAGKFGPKGTKFPYGPYLTKRRYLWNTASQNKVGGAKRVGGVLVETFSTNYPEPGDIDDNFIWRYNSKTGELKPWKKPK